MFVNIPRTCLTLVSIIKDLVLVGLKPKTEVETVLGLYRFFSVAKLGASKRIRTLHRRRSSVSGANRLVAGPAFGEVHKVSVCLSILDVLKGL